MILGSGDLPVVQIEEGLTAIGGFALGNLEGIGQISGETMPTPLCQIDLEAPHVPVSRIDVQIVLVASASPDAFLREVNEVADVLVKSGHIQHQLIRELKIHPGLVENGLLRLQIGIANVLPGPVPVIAIVPVVPPEHRELVEMPIGEPEHAPIRDGMGHPDPGTPVPSRLGLHRILKPLEPIGVLPALHGLALHSDVNGIILIPGINGIGIEVIHPGADVQNHPLGLELLLNVSPRLISRHVNLIPVDVVPGSHAVVSPVNIVELELHASFPQVGLRELGGDVPFQRVHHLLVVPMEQPDGIGAQLIVGL